MAGIDVFSRHFRRKEVTRPGVVLACLALLTGCFSTSVFAPAYSEAVDELVTEGYGAAATITACIDLGLCADAASFDDYEVTYVTAFARLKAAERLIGELSVSGNSITAVEARDLLLGQVQGCKAQLLSLMEEHRDNGVPPGIGFSQPVDTACEQALRASRAMR